ncbi:MAG: T9SS type A sorting domain-containing protein [Bacteroidetes bacterium]|nr:MAG: T9SS type A sorting domain-containing protein [Bacteroidota bacterium]
MKQKFLLALFIFSLSVNAQDFYSSGDCKAAFKFEVNTNIYTLLPATAINFYDTSEGKVKAWYWDFGDGNTSEEQNPMFIFNHPIGGPNVKINPYKTVRLTIVTDSCKSTISQVINIMEGVIYEPQTCFARFKYYEMSRDSAAGTVTFHFDDRSEGKELSYLWQFTDEITSTEHNPEITLPLGQPEYKVCLTVTGADSCVSTVCEPVYVQPHIIWDTVFTDPIQQNCLALFKYYESGRDTVGGTAKIVFNNYSEGKDLKYFWQFGDLETSTEKEPVHKFSLDQTEYKVCLTVTGPDGCSSIDCKPVYLEYPVIIDTIINPDCFVDFAFERKDVLMSPLPSVALNFYSKSYPEATEWFWDFGDGTTSEEPKPTHVYTMPAISDSIKMMYNPFRTVCLTVKTANECKVSICQTIQVFGWVPEPEPEKCPVYFKYYRPDDIMSIPEVVPIQLVDVSEGEVISRLWQFEDGSTSTEKEPLKTFNIFQPVHKVCLTVTFADSCTNTFCDAVYVSNGYTDTVVVVDPIIINPDCPYYMKIDGGFPPEMSSCAGWASVKVYLKDEEVIPQIISWSTGDTLAKVNGLCPTRTYTVKALMPDGCAIWTNFIFNSDGSVTPVSPINWWLDGKRENLMIKADAAPGMKVEWRLCDGTVVEADSVLLADINCGTDQANLIIKDDLGNVIYTENIALKGSVTGIYDIPVKPEIKLWPNPVTSKLNIQYSGEYQSKIMVEISDITGKQVLSEIHSNIFDGQEFTVNTEALKQGLYICRVSSIGKTIKSHKFSKK